jgi:hypothetical protein
MEQVKGLPLGRQLILGAGVLLLIDTFLPWQKVSFSAFGVSASHSWTAWHGFWGVLMSLMVIVLVAWVAARAFGVELPANIPDGLTTLALAALILLFAVIKNLADDYSAWGSYLGIVLAAAVAVGAWLTFQLSGEALPNVGGMGSSSASGSATPTAQEPEAHEPPATDPV